MGIYGKIKALIQKKKPSPNYTRKEWVFKLIQLLIYCLGIDLSGMKLYSIDVAVAYNQITADAAYGFMYAYYCGIHGLFWGLAVWRIFELHWWSKDMLIKLHEKELINE
jgi:hypothetical protein